MGLVKRSQTTTDVEHLRKVTRDMSGLLQLLQTGDVTSRRWAARDLVQYPQAVSGLLDSLAQETDRTVREAIFVTLTQLNSQPAVDGLIACLRSEEVNLRNDAIEAMKLMPEAVAPMMNGLLHDPDPDVRIFAVNILESLRHPDVEAWLVEVILNDPHINVCATAVDLLAEVGGKSAIPALEALRLKFPDEPFMHFGIEVALKRIQGD